MTKYIYEAYNKKNKIVHGEYDTGSREAMVDYLIKRELTPVSVRAVSEIKKKQDFLSIQLFEKITSVDIMFLVRNLSTTVKAGLSIIESFDILIKDTKNKLMRKILERVQSIVQNGQTLSVGFETYKNLFPPIFIGMIKAGEVSGQLDKTLKELSLYLSKEYTLRNKVKSAFVYPIILLVASTVVVTLMLIFVLPRLTKSFAASDVALPWITKFFLFISNALTWSLTLDVIVLAGIIGFFIYFKKTKTGKKILFSIASRTPVAGDLIKKIAIVRFARTFGNLIGSGLSVTESLEISATSVNNSAYTNVIRKTIEDIKNGISISASFSKHPDLFPNLLVSLISVGERTGSLQEILVTFSDFYEEEVDNNLKELTSYLEPVLLLIMGLMIGAIAVSIILPIYQLVGNFV
jgi:type II secretory pathway component PulF